MLGWVGTTLYLLFPVGVWFVILKVWPGLGDPWTAFFVAWIPWTLHEIYDRWPWLNLQVKRIWLWMSNAPMQWEVKAEYSGDVFQGFRKARKWLKSQGAKVETEGERGVTVRLPDNSYITLELARVLIMGEDTEQLIVKTAANMPFKSGKQALERWVVLFEEIQKTAGVKAKYTFSLAFQDGQNPYFGLFVRMLGGEAVRDLRFSVEFKEDGGRVTVRRDKVSIVTRSVSELQALSGRYVTLSAVPTLGG